MQEPTAFLAYCAARVANLGNLIEINPPENFGNAASELTTQKHGANKQNESLIAFNILFK